MELMRRIAAQRDSLVSYVAALFGADKSTAEDIAHDTIAKAFEKQMQFRGAEHDGQLWEWLCSIARHIGFRLRTRSRRCSLLHSVDLADGCFTPSGIMRLREERLRVFDAVSELSQTQRYIIVRRYFDGWTIKRIAVDLNMNAARVSQCKSRALSRLSRSLTPEEFQTLQG